MKYTSIAFGAACLFAAAAALADFHDWAPSPPMGWNSWDSFGCTITEEQAKAQADAQAKLLKPSGWTLLTIDIQWYHDGAKGHEYEDGAKLEMDQWGRLMPAPKRFPSSAGGKGFKPLADYVHSKGLSFGIHIMRGIPRNAVKADTPIKGCAARAASIADSADTCPWNPNMYGIDMRKPGAQNYYDSILELYASWGVDFIKIDDISRPYNSAQMLEIEAMRKAIDRCGRRIVLSLSPGDTPRSAAPHVARFANMWRISDDFWDEWKPLLGMFARLHSWEISRVPGSWPDADMLPFGKVSFGRECRFTKDEQRTCMTLWCIARSPLILGADMTRLDDWTLSLLTNRDVLAVNQQGSRQRELFRDIVGGLAVWISNGKDLDELNVALFNIGSEKKNAAVPLARLGFAGDVDARDLWNGGERQFSGELHAEIPPHGCALYRLAPSKSPLAPSQNR